MAFCLCFFYCFLSLSLSHAPKRIFAVEFAFLNHCEHFHEMVCKSNGMKNTDFIPFEITDVSIWIRA